MRALAFFRPNPDDPALCELVVSIDGKLTRIPFSRDKCILSLRELLPFIEAPE
jgi:hypothetical protein